MEVSDSMPNIILSISIILVCISTLIVIGLGIWYKYATYKEEKENREMLAKLREYTKFLGVMRKKAEARLKKSKDKEQI